MQPTEYDTTTLTAVPVGKLISAPGEGQMHGNADYMWEGLNRWRTLKQVFVPVVDVPIGRRCPGNARQSETRGQYMLAVTCSRVLGIEGVDQQCVMTLHRSTRLD
jgi:hypothetical protein